MFDELVIDNFAGGGGASLGIERAIGRACDLAINHDEAAIAMHRANHPATPHRCENIWQVDPVEATGGRRVGVAWFSPDCKHFSRAKGAKPVDKRIRGLAWIVVKWARAVRPRVIFLENVREFETWGPLTDDNMPCQKRKGLTFRRWVGCLRNLGYAVESKILNAADYGAPTHRRRLFIIARCDGLPIVWPEPTHGPGRAKPYRTAAECIDWTLPCPSIFERKRPLAEKTLRRIAMGIKRYVLDNPKPFIVRVQHGRDEFRGQSIDQPLGTVTAKHGYGVVAPHMVEVQNGSSETGHRAVDRPAHTITANPKGGGMALVAPHLSSFYGEAPHQDTRGQVVEQPINTVVPAPKHALVSAFMQQYFGGMVGKPATEPVPTVTAIDHNALTTATLVGVGGRAGQSPPTAVDEPIRTTTAKADRALVAAHLTKFRGESKGAPVNAPMPTITSGAGSKRPAGAAHAMGVSAAHLTQLRGSNQGKGDIDEPVPTLTAGGNHIGLVRAFLAKYYGQGVGQTMTDPLHTVTVKDRFGLVVIDGVDYAITDIGLRMLTPRELARAQGFPDDYILTGSKSNQVAKIGNSVCPVMAEVLVRANYVEQPSMREAVSA